MKRFALIGENIGYSKSRAIHNAFYDVAGIRAEYEILDIPSDEFDTAVMGLWAFDGFNVTKPYKERIIPYLEKTDLVSVNTVTVSGGILCGHNTDGAGFGYAVRDIVFEGKAVLILGAGGAAAGIAAEVARRGGDIFIYNRTEERALRLIEKLKTGQLMRGGVCPQIIINTTTVGQTANELSLPAFVDTGKTEYIYDAIYRKTPLLEYAESKGIKFGDGYSMLVGQAVYAECIFNNMAVSGELIEKVFDRLRETEKE